MARIAAIGALVLILAAGQPRVALAHARFDHSTPSPGQVVETPPTVVDIFTAQEMRKIAGANTITVVGPDGKSVTSGDAVVDDSNREHFSVGLSSGLPPGRYVVSFQTLSDADGEADHGQFAFYIGSQPSNDQKLQDQKLTLTAQADDAAAPSHTGLYIAIAAGVAILLFVLVGGAAVIRRRRSST